MTQMKPIEIEKLFDIIDADGEIERVADHGECALIRWADGSRCWMRYRDGDWRFPDGNAAYQAGYAYACGYHD